MNWILETSRLKLRELVVEDLVDLKEILQDEETMTAYEGAFSDEEAEAWLLRQQDRYQENGFGLWAVILKETGELVGQCGITLQSIETEWVQEVGYLFKRRFWHQGYATEAAKACMEHAFAVFHAAEVYAIIRDSNQASRRVAERIGMTPSGRMVKHYRGVEMPHILYKRQCTVETGH